MSDRRPPDYSEVDGCHNCSISFRMGEHDCEDTYFCCHGAPARPPCCSVALDEYDFERSCDEMCLDLEFPTSWTARASLARMRCRARGWTRDTSQYDEWREWSEGRLVQPWGICEHWQILVVGKNDDS